MYASSQTIKLKINEFFIVLKFEFNFSSSQPPSTYAKITRTRSSSPHCEHRDSTTESRRIVDMCRSRGKKSKLISGGKLVFGYPQREAIFSHNFFYSASSLSRPPPLSLFSDFFPTARHRRFLPPPPALRSYTHTHWSLTARVKAVMVATSLVCFSCVYNFPSN